MPAPGSPAHWLHHARSDLALAAARKTRRVLYEHLCFHAQQAAEKSLKAILLHLGSTPPKTHDLAFLLDQLPRRVAVPVTLIDLPILTKYAVQLRYPGETGPITAREHRAAVALARQAVQWATSLILPQ